MNSKIADKSTPTLEDGIKLLESLAETRWKRGFSKAIIRDVIKSLRTLQLEGNRDKT